MGYKRIMRLLAASLVCAVLASSPAAAADSLSSLRFLVGTWNCSYQAGRTHVDYRATYSYDLGNNWLRENDSWTHGGSDLGMITYEPRTRQWVSAVMDDQRTVVVFHAGGSNPNHLVYHSAYPNAALTNVFDRNSPTRYTLHFSGKVGGRSLKSTDVCTKV
jgi:opacity protein-like surface antigen